MALSHVARFAPPSRPRPAPGRLPGCSDPRREVDVVADVPLVRDEGRSGVHADPNLDAAGRQRVGRRSRRRERPVRGREGEEERVALRVDLDARVS